MSFTFHSRPSDSPFVHTIWHTVSLTDGCYTASADGSWDIIINRHPAQSQVLLCGPASRAARVPYLAGTDSLGIRFHLGAFMPTLATHHILDLTHILSGPDSNTFSFNGMLWELPTFENADTFLQRLSRQQLFARDNLVQSILQGQTPADLSARTVQRHFVHTTGLTYAHLRQIQRAHRAAALLRQGEPILNVVYDLGFTDQSHLTKSLKQIIGTTPAQLRVAQSSSAAFDAHAPNIKSGQINNAALSS